MIRRKFFLSACTALCLLWSGKSTPTSELELAEITDDSSSAGGKVLLPLFPLNMVAYPGQMAFLHIFEPRYRELIVDCERQGITFGISPIHNNQLSAYGTEMKLERILKTDEAGNMDVALRGVRVYRLDEYRHIVSGKLYSGGMVSFQSNDSSFDPAVQDKLVAQFNQLLTATSRGQGLSGKIPGNLSYVIGDDVHLSMIQKIQLIAFTSESERQSFLSRHLDKILENINKPDQVQSI